MIVECDLVLKDFHTPLTLEDEMLHNQMLACHCQYVSKSENS
jgi:hypothetical protein